MLDYIDKALLQAPQLDGRLSNVELARKIKVSPPATHARLRRLEKEGYDRLCFIHISLQMHQLEQAEKFRKPVRQMPEVLEGHHITGEYDYLLKVEMIDTLRADKEYARNHIWPAPVGVDRFA